MICSNRRGDGEGRLTAAELGAELGERLTLVQFSSAFCMPCPATRLALEAVVAGRSGVEHIELDAESELSLVRRLGVERTPTVLALDRSGRVIVRLGALAGTAQASAVLDALLERDVALDG